MSWMVNQAAQGAFSKALESALGTAQVYRDTNDPMYEEVPYESTSRAKPIPRLMVLRYADADIITTNYVQFGWKLPQMIDGYNRMTLVCINTNMTYYNTPGGMMGIQMQFEGGATLSSNMISSAVRKGNAGYLPTFLVPNAINTSNSAPQFCLLDYGEKPFSVNIRGVKSDSLQVILGDESFQPYSTKSGSGTYTWTGVFWLE